MQHMAGLYTAHEFEGVQAELRELSVDLSWFLVNLRRLRRVFFS